MNRHTAQINQVDRRWFSIPILGAVIQRLLTKRLQAGGQRVFKKLDPERFPLCGEGVLPPVLSLSPVPIERQVPVRQRRRGV